MRRWIMMATRMARDASSRRTSLRLAMVHADNKIWIFDENSDKREAFWDLSAPNIQLWPYLSALKRSRSV